MNIKVTAIFFVALALAFLPPTGAGARDYTPVDQLGHGASLPPVRQPAIRQPAAKQPAQATARPASATPRAGATARSSSPSKLFGTVEFQKPLTSLPGWLDVIRRNSANPIFSPPRHFTKTVTWEKLRQSASGKGPLDQLRLINSFWNDWPYREDITNWGVEDYWAIPAEFLQKSGDCEDYAIAKYFTLKELGFPPDKMRLVVLRDTVRNLPHAVLVVYLDNDAYVLDNLSKVVLSHGRLGNYQPQYSVNEFGRWAHIKPKGKSR